MNAARKKEMKRKSLKRELRQAKFLFWQLEEKYVWWLIRAVNLSIRSKKWKDWEWRKNMARRNMVAAEEEKKLAQVEWDNFQRLERKKLQKGKKKRVKLRRR